MKTAARRLPGARAGIPPRHIDFKFPEQAPRHFFFDGNPAASSIFAVFSGIFPPGERFFVESVRHFRDRIDDPDLKARVSGFIGQESLHGREHERLNEWFAERGIDTRPSDRRVSWALRQLERFSPEQQLACTTMMEHFTAILAEHWLTDEDFRSKADPEMLKLWSWHALEELEHKSVAHEVYEKIGGGGERERRRAVTLVVLFLLPGIVASWLELSVRGGALRNPREFYRGLVALLGRKGFLTRVARKFPFYLREGFHPAKHDTRALEARTREQLFGEAGELRDQWKNREALAV